LTSWARRLRRLRQLSWSDRSLLAEACLWLAVARLAVLMLPFRWIAPRLGRQMEELPEGKAAPEQLEQARRVSWAVLAMSRLTPWQSACLAQAIAAKRLLQVRGVPSTLYMGLAKDESATLQAHAWLRCGDFVVTGGQARERYTVVATFGGGDS
jgi:hypothetical protein